MSSLQQAEIIAYDQIRQYEESQVTERLAEVLAAAMGATMS